MIWEGHRAGRDIGYCHIEKLHNLEALPATGFTVLLLSGQGPRRLRRLDARRRDHRHMSHMKSSLKNLTIDAERLWDDLMQTAKIGGTAKGGICRLTLTDLDT